MSSCPVERNHYFYCRSPGFRRNVASLLRFGVLRREANMDRRMLRLLTVSTSAFAPVAVLASGGAATGAAVRSVPTNFDATVMHGKQPKDAIATNPLAPSIIVTT